MGTNRNNSYKHRHRIGRRAKHSDRQPCVGAMYDHWNQQEFESTFENWRSGHSRSVRCMGTRSHTKLSSSLLGSSINSSSSFTFSVLFWLELEPPNKKNAPRSWIRRWQSVLGQRALCGRDAFRRTVVTLCWLFNMTCSLYTGTRGRVTKRGELEKDNRYIGYLQR